MMSDTQNNKTNGNGLPTSDLSTLTRRTFVGAGSAAATAVMASARQSAAHASASGASRAPIAVAPKDRAVVFIMLDGGNDSYNMLVPTSGTHYGEYRKTRSNLALGEGDLLPLDGVRDAEGRSFGLHNAMPEVGELFAKRKLSFIANIAPMVEPVSKENFLNGSARLPLGLLSHADQFQHWQTARPDMRANKGWLGFIADSVQPNRAEDDIPMGISMAGNNVAQNGNLATPYAITADGSVGLYVKETRNELNEAIMRSFNHVMEMGYDGDPFKESYLKLTRQAQLQHEKYKRATDAVRLSTRFSDTPVSQQLRKVAQSIKAARDLGHRQQSFFVRYIGWDHHDELINKQAGMLRILSRALGEFQASLDELGLADQVVTFTGSDFGRTLTSNGNGTDHGWGGNTIVMGNPVEGGKIFGQYPGLGLGNDNPLDAGNGVLIPTTSADELCADLALWFGAGYRDLNQLFPNLARFYNSASERPPLGIMKA